jgi:transaldolase
LIRADSSILPKRKTKATLKALAEHEEFGETLPADADAVLAEFGLAGIDTDGVATQLLGEGIASFDKSWNDLPACIASKNEALKAA